jgi:hypothetical protein
MQDEQLICDKLYYIIKIGFREGVHTLGFGRSWDSEGFRVRSQGSGFDGIGEVRIQDGELVCLAVDLAALDELERIGYRGSWSPWSRSCRTVSAKQLLSFCANLVVTKILSGPRIRSVLAFGMKILASARKYLANPCRRSCRSTGFGLRSPGSGSSDPQDRGLVFGHQNRLRTLGRSCGLPGSRAN